MSGELKGACIFGQSGGPTAVINASAYGVLKTALESDAITNVYGAAHGIRGVLDDRLYDIGQEDPDELRLLLHTPSSELGSCRYKMADPDTDDTDYRRILEIFRKYNVRYFFYNGGNDSMDTCNKISKYMQKVGYECRIMGVPAGLGDPVFEKLDANLSKALVSIGAVKGIEIGDGFAAAHAVGSENNDSFYINEDGNTAKKTNHAGGILGGISDGDTIIVRAAVKPTPSIFRPQQTISRNKEPMELTIKGRHDPLIVPRAVVVVEAMCALTIADSLLLNMTAQMDGVLCFYNK